MHKAAYLPTPMLIRVLNTEQLYLLIQIDVLLHSYVVLLLLQEYFFHYCVCASIKCATGAWLELSGSRFGLEI